MLRARRMGPQGVIGVKHLADVEGGREGPAGFHILVIMAHVGGDDDPAAACMHADELHAGRMAADRMNTDPRREFDRPVVELDAAREIEPHDADDILDLERASEERVAHVAAGRVMQFDFLQMKLRFREAVECPDMVVMHVGQDHIVDGVAVEPDQGQRLGGATQVPPAACRGDLGGKPGIDHKTALAPIAAQTK